MEIRVYDCASGVGQTKTVMGGEKVEEGCIVVPDQRLVCERILEHFGFPLAHVGVRSHWA